MSAPVRAATYYRMSTDKQEDSIDRQRSQVVPYAARQGYELAGEYADEGIAGDEFGRRAAFQRLLRDAQAGRFQVIVCDELTRLSRQEIVEFIATVVHPLKAAGVSVDSAAEGPQDWDGVVSIILLAIRQDRSASESPAISRRVLTRLLTIASSGGYTGGPPPYGYRLEPDPARGKRLVPDPVRSEHVRLMFRLADEGRTLNAIRDALDARGVPSPTGKRLWSRNGILRVLHNRKYTGCWVWGVQAQGKHFRQAKGEPRGRRRGEARFATNVPEDWIIVPDSHEPLVDRETFDRVQARLKGNRRRWLDGDRTPQVGGGGFLLNRLLVCGHCGSHMLGSTWNGQRGYSCGGYLNYGKAHCHKNSVYEAPLVRVILRKLQDAFLNPENLERLREEVRRQQETRQSPDAVRRLERAVGTLDAQIAKANRNVLLLDDDLRAGAAAELRAMKAERDRLAAELEGAKACSLVNDLEREVAEAEALLWRLHEASDQHDVPLLRQLLREMVSRVELHFRHWATPCRSRSALERGVIHVRTQAGTSGAYLTGNVSSSASTAQPVEKKLANCDLPPGSSLTISFTAADLAAV